MRRHLPSQPQPSDLLDHLHPSHPSPQPVYQQSASFHQPHLPHSTHILSLPDTLAIHVGFFRRGFLDSSKLGVVLDALAMNKELQGSIIKNTTLQVILLVSVFAFDILLPRALGHGTPSHLRLLFDALWLCPLSLASALWSGLLSVRVSKSIHSSSAHARKTPTPATLYRGLAARMGSESHRILALVNYLVLSRLLQRVPLVGQGLSFGYCAVANSYYCFEQRWTSKGLGFEERIQCLEQRWTYHAGFGMLITLASFWHPSPFVNLALFALLFPFLVILSSSASVHPLPLAPHDPLGSGDSEPRPPATLFPRSMPVFWPARTLHRVLLAGLSPGHTRSRSAAGARFNLEQMEGGSSESPQPRHDQRVAMQPQFGLNQSVAFVPASPIIDHQTHHHHPTLHHQAAMKNKAD